MSDRRSARGYRGICCGILVLQLAVHEWAAGLSTQQARVPDLDDVLTRAGQYAVDYGLALTSVLAEETYVQRLVWRGGREAFEERRLRSEMAFVRLTDSTEWLAFRNVLTVNQRPIPEADGRLERLFSGSHSLPEQARLIAGESARYNIGPITREINAPTTALHFVHPQHRPNCRFDKDSEETLDGERVWIVRFKARDRGSLIRRGDGRNLPAEGRLWIVPADGRVVRSELVVKDFVRGSGDSKAEIRVKWRHDASLDLWVPAEMREEYEGPWLVMSPRKRRERYDIEGVATYSNYRRFTVDVRIR
jgi:hypothetical protein